MRAAIPVVAPLGRDGDAIAGVLAGIGQRCLHVATVGALEIDDETPMLLLTEEALGGDLQPLTGALDAQPTWSDLPILLLTAGGGRRGTPARWKLFERLGNVTLLDRPVQAGVLHSAVRSALRARARQYQARRYLDDLRAARDELEQRVEHRTAQLKAEIDTRRQTEAALERAQRLEAIGQMTGGVAHDFNNLLQVITSGIALLQMDRLDAPRRASLLDSMQTASQRGARLTHQLLAFARRQPLSAEALDLNGCVAQLQELLRGTLRGSQQLQLQLAEDLWPVDADATQLDVALLNTVFNARDAMPVEGTVTIATRNRRLSRADPPHVLDGEFAEICIADTGCGMDAETINRAFEPFYTTKSVGEGTGLGLSQVYGFAHQSGGGVHIDSRPGQGTRLSIFLPRSSTVPTAQDDARALPCLQGRGSVLVVEDEPPVAELICALLDALGYECVHVTDADAALREDPSRFRAVITDVIMPGRLDGVDLATELRRRHPKLPILLATGYAGDPKRLVDAGFPLLQKPFGVDDLNRALDEAGVTADAA